MTALTNSPSPTAAPVAESERIHALDVVRGLAVLGILVMNVVEFGLPIHAYADPRVAGGTDGADRWTFLVQQALFDGRMRALFSMLFGAGLLLIGERLQRSNRATSAADLLLRRCLWLVPFGLLHRFALQWTGDILYLYGLLGALAVAFRNLRPRTQIVAGLLCLAAFTPIELLHHRQAAALRDRATAAQQLRRAGAEVPADLADAQMRWERRQQPPTAKDSAAEIAAIRGSYATVFGYRWDYHHTFQSAYLYHYFVWDVFGMMLIGMGLCRIGFFAGHLRTGSYLAMLAAGSFANAASFWFAWQQAATQFATDDLVTAAVQRATYPFLRGLGGLGWAAALLLCVRAGALRCLTTPLAATGRMAFSNYVLQTVCCTLWFFGYGLGHYGEMARHQLMLVWAAVSAAQVAFSMWWLRAFRFGPLEWVWRSLTWWQRQPMRRTRQVDAADRS